MTAPTPPVLAPFHFTAPPVNPTAFGLYAVTDWEPEDASRFLHGVEVRGNSYPNGQSAGVWNAPWCGDPAPGQLKQGTRQDILDAFEPMTLWAADECDLTEPTRAADDALLVDGLHHVFARNLERAHLVWIGPDAHRVLP